jgi:hypothetical protein
VTGKFKNLWKDETADPFDDGEPTDARQPKQDYLHEGMDTIVLGLNAVGIVWVRALQLRRMRPRDKLHLLGQAWFTRHCVSRNAKYRALQKLEAAGHFRVVRSDHRGPRIGFIDKRRQKRTGRRQNRTPVTVIPVSLLLRHS